MNSAGLVESSQVFLFVNPKSGGQVGQVFLEVPQPFKVEFDDEDREVSLNIFSLPEGRPGNKPGFHALRRVVDSGCVARVIVGGGDGTVMWLVTEAERHGIRPNGQLHIGIVPLGTGNDFSQHLGWGGKNPDRRLLDNDCELLGKLVQSWFKARPAMHDVWQLSFSVCQDSGQIFQKDEPLDECVRQTPMLLYAGIAKDAEVAYQVELHRQKKQWCNKVVYGLMSVRSMLSWFCCRAQRVRRVISGMYAGNSKDAPPVFECGRRSEGPHLLSNPELLLFTNIDSFAGGQARRLWGNSYRVGVDEVMDEELLEREQDPGDMKLEVLTFRRLLRFVMPTRDLLAGRRVYQGAPVHVVFRRKSDLVTFLQVDGESYKLLNPLSLTIEHKQQISVLHCVKPTQLSNSLFALFNCTGAQGYSSEEEDDDGNSSPLVSGP
mmetsp:Transcript_4477/g.10513  ORF Transcript_4477/g.10513 Transcript_4477/m.10513 type:complete len:434 (-) Transcript_4477:151-1452(-)